MGEWDISIYAVGGKNCLRSEFTSKPGPPIPRHIWTSTHVVPYTVLQPTAYVRTAYGTIYFYSIHELTRSEFRRTAIAKTIAARRQPVMSCPTSDTMVEVTGFVFVLRFCFCILLFYLNFRINLTIPRYNYVISTY